MTVEDLLKIYIGNVEFVVKREKDKYIKLYNGSAHCRKAREFECYNIVEVLIENDILSVELDMDDIDFYDFKKMNVEDDHTIEEYMIKYGADYENGDLWGISKDELEDGTLEVDENMTYWLIDNTYYETN